MPAVPAYGPPVPESSDPLPLFGRWLQEAIRSEPNDPEAMSLATVGADGMPSSRMVLLKAHDAHGFVWYTNTQSRKGEQLAHHAKAALLFHWKSLRRQVRLEGTVMPVSAVDADAYFSTRNRMAQVGAWASQQSRPLDSREALAAAVAAAEARFDGQEVSRPPYWSGYRLQPLYMEFWQEQAFRLHDRVVYTRPTATAAWTHARLFP